MYKRNLLKLMRITILSLCGFFIVTLLAGCGDVANEQMEYLQLSEIVPQENLVATRSQMQLHYCSERYSSLHRLNESYHAFVPEQLVHDMVRNQFETAGLSLHELSQPLSVVIDDVYTELLDYEAMWSGEASTPMRVEGVDPYRTLSDDIYLHFIDEATGIGLVFILNWESSWWTGCEGEVRSRITQRFLLEHGISVQVLFDQGISTRNGVIHYWDEKLDELVFFEGEAANERAYELAAEKMSEQIQAFINRQSRE